MLQPKKTKFRRQQKGVMKGNSQRGHQLAFGSFGIKSLETTWMTGRQLEAARVIFNQREIEANIVLEKNRIIECGHMTLWRKRVKSTLRRVLTIGWHDGIESLMVASGSVDWVVGQAKKIEETANTLNVNKSVTPAMVKNIGVD